MIVKKNIDFFFVIGEYMLSFYIELLKFKKKLKINKLNNGQFDAFF